MLGHSDTMVATLFARTAAELLDHGYSPIPIMEGHKAPGVKPNGRWLFMKEWSQYCDRRPTDQEIREWSRFEGAGIGVACGYDGLVAIDIDTDDDQTIKAIISAVPDSPVKKKGKKGWTSFYRDPSGTIRGRKFKHPENGMICEILAKGNQTVCPPSIHPETGQPYVWMTQYTLENTRIEDLPELPPNVAELFEQALTSYIPPKERYQPKTGVSVGDRKSETGFDAYASAALEGEVSQLAKTVKPGRNDQLFKAAAKLSKWVREGFFSENEVRGWLVDACKINGLIDDPQDGLASVRRSMESGFKTGWDDPLPVLDDNPKKSAGAASNGEFKDNLRQSVSVFTLAELQNTDFPPVNWIVPDLIPEGLTIFAGKPKLGKSWMALGICVSVATGGQALGTYACEAGDVLYLALEDNERRLKARMEQMLGKDAQWPQRVTVITRLPPDDKEGLRTIHQWIDQSEKSKLIVIDTFQRVRPHKSNGKNTYADDYRDCIVFQEVTGEHGIAIVLVHHLRKAEADDPFDMVSGSTGLTGAADTTLILKREPGRADATLYGRGRDLEEVELALEFDKTTGNWKILGQAEDYRLEENRAKIKSYLDELGEGETAGPKEIAEELDISVDNAKQTLSRMVKDGQIKKIGRGQYAAVG